MRILPPGFVPPCLPTKAECPPSGELWLHEIKHDGFRVIARKDGAKVRLYSRPGNDLTYRFPLIVEFLGSAAPAVLRHRWGGRRLRRERSAELRAHPISAPR
jgi:ATP-dependent DNA ligase